MNAVSPDQAAWSTLTAVLDTIDGLRAASTAPMAAPELLLASEAIREAVERLSAPTEAEPEPEPEPDSNPWLGTAHQRSRSADFASEAEYTKYMRANSKRGCWLTLTAEPPIALAAQTTTVGSVGQVISYTKEACLCAWPTPDGGSAVKVAVPWLSLAVAEGQEHWDQLKASLKQQQQPSSQNTPAAASAAVAAWDCFMSARMQLQELESTGLPAGAWTDGLTEQLAQLAAAMEVAVAPPAELETIKSELKCYVTLDDHTQDILGFGLTVSRHGRSNDIKDITSPCEPLSKAAWFEDNVRESSYRQQLHSWIPLYIDSDHMQRGAEALRQAFVSIATGSRGNGKQQQACKPEHILTVLPKLLNSMIVDLARGDSGAKSLRLLNGFCQLHRLFLHLIDTDAALRALVDHRLRSFVNGATSKKDCPNLGEWLVLLSVSEAFEWDQVATHYLAESGARNVRWYGRDHPQLISDTLHTTNKMRCDLVFDATRVSRGLLCFSVFFLRTIARPSGRSLAQVSRDLDRRLGQPAPLSLEALQEAAGRIAKIGTWSEHFEWIDRPVLGEDQLGKVLLQAVASSLRLGYHGPPGGAFAGGDPRKRPGRGGGGGGRGRGGDKQHAPRGGGFGRGYR